MGIDQTPIQQEGAGVGLAPAMVARARPATWPLVLASVVLFGISCFLPSLGFRIYNSDGAATNERHSDFGIWLLLIGWMGMLVGQFGWCANVLLLLSWILGLCRLYVVAGVIALAAIAVAMDTLAMYAHSFPADEGGVRKTYLEGLGVGFYSWMGSMVLMAVACVRGIVKTRQGV